MDELTIGDKVYISSKRAAKITGYAKDYVGQLCREGRVEARLVGRNWYVLEASILEHRFGVGEEAQEGPVETLSHKSEVVSTTDSWSQPVYEAQVQEPVVPVLLKNPDTESAKRVVSEMQSAWQEWFAAQPAASAPVQDEEVVVMQEEVDQEPETQEETVHISRVPEPQEYYESTPYTSNQAPEALYRNEAPLTHETEQYTEEAPASSARPNVLHYSLARALCVFAITVSIVAAVLGSGVVGDVLLQNYHLDGWLLSTVQYLGGESEFINR